jgi:DNA-binding transcriptional ArsR family regulator
MDFDDGLASEKLDRFNPKEVDGHCLSKDQIVRRDASLLRALANPHRLAILRLLEKKPLTVMEICAELTLRQSLVSQHLARLRHDGIVNANRRGHNVFYALGNARAGVILSALRSAS